MQTIHISWRLTIFFAAFVIGVWLVGYLNLIKMNNQQLTILVVLGAMFFFMMILGRGFLLIALMAILSGVIIGYCRGYVVLESHKSMDNQVGQEIVLWAVVAEDPSVNRRGVSLVLDDINWQANNHHKKEKYTGKIWALIDKKYQKQIERSDVIAIKGLLDSGFGGFPYSIEQGKVLKLQKRALADPFRLGRDWFVARLDNVLSKDQAALGMGLLAGQKTALNADIQQAFLAASLTHILVASGYNLTILVRFARRILAKHSRLLALILSVVLVLSFAAITGLSASMYRAVLVAILSLLAWFVGRNFHPIVLIATVAAITIAVEPSQVWGDVGWYLSFASFIGVVILAPLITDLLIKVTSGNTEELKTIPTALNDKWGKLGSVIQIVVETMSAQLVAWPVISYFMGTVSILGLITNAIVLPIVPVTMLFTFLAGIGAIFLPLSIAEILAWPAQQLLNIILLVANRSQELSWAQIDFQLDSRLLLVYYIVLGLLMIGAWRYTNHNFRRDNVIE